MKRWLFVLLLGLLLPTLSACSSNERARLRGLWQGSAPNNGCSLQFDNTPGRVTITFANGTSVSGTYTLLAGDFVEFELDSSWNGTRKHREKITVIGSTLTMKDP